MANEITNTFMYALLIKVSIAFGFIFKSITPTIFIFLLGSEFAEAYNQNT